jgi:hypothetical protein
MERLIDKYLDGDFFAKEMLIDKFIELYEYDIDRTEALFLIEKKYGKAKIF